jgi:lipoprotein Spr
MPFRYLFLLLLTLFISCYSAPDAPFEVTAKDTVENTIRDTSSKILNGYVDGEPITTIKTGNTTPAALLTFARTLNGVPYKYGSSTPTEGFDCSGFITYVFNHFMIAVPRQSADFINVKHEVALKDAKPGDLILFKGTDSTQNVVGHMGILVSAANDGHSFIHSTSGKANGVTETPLNAYYQGRFVKVVRVFHQNNE